jgi:hypothetical protein
MIDPLHDPNDPNSPRKSRFWALRASARIPHRPPQWPLEQFGDRAPMLVGQQTDDKRKIAMLGYEPRHYDAQLFVAVYAARDGRVMFCGETNDGLAVAIEHHEHNGKWGTYYSQLSKVLVGRNLYEKRKRLQAVRAGDCIGYTAKSPLQIGFEVMVWTHDRGFVSLDPVEAMKNWGVKPLPVAPQQQAMKEAA